MPEQETTLIFNYWGKADPACSLEQKWHPLAYHSMDVAVVAASWWDASPTIQRTFLSAFGCTPLQQNRLRAWVLFFTALHDIGKFDVRFQLKAPDALAAAWRPLGTEDHGISPRDITGFDHGWAGMAWANQEYRWWLGQDDVDCEIWEQWKP